MNDLTPCSLCGCPNCRDVLPPEPSAAFQDFRADVLFLVLCSGNNWPPTETQRERYRLHKCRSQLDRLERAIADLWGQAQTAALFAPIESQEGRVPVESHKLDMAGSTPAPATNIDEQSIQLEDLDQLVKDVNELRAGSISHIATIHMPSWQCPDCGSVIMRCGGEHSTDEVAQPSSDA